MNSKVPRLYKLITTVAVAGLLGWALAGGLSALGQLMTVPTSTGVSYSGQATVINLQDMHNSAPIVICDTGPLPSTGGFIESSVIETNVSDGELTFELADATTDGNGPEARSAASLNNLFLEIMATDGTVSTLRADFISAEASASCEPNGKADVSATVRIEGLVLNGQAVKVAKKPGQVVYFPGGRIVINEQASTANGTSGHLTVTALHIMVDGCMNGLVCFAEADITCGSVAPPPECGKLTGGGWIVGTPTGDKGTFGVSGGIRRGAYWGHLNYIDHGTGMHVKSTAVTGFTVDPNDSRCRIITYNVLIDGAAGTATVHACDYGEPGDSDIFDITLSNGYHAGGDLGGAQPGGGNIQIHKCPPGWM